MFLREVACSKKKKSAQQQQAMQGHILQHTTCKPEMMMISTHTHRSIIVFWGSSSKSNSKREQRGCMEAIVCIAAAALALYLYSLSFSPPRGRHLAACLLEERKVGPLKKLHDDEVIFFGLPKIYFLNCAHDDDE